MPVIASLWSAPIMHTEVQAGSTQCMHCAFENEVRSPNVASRMTFLVVPLRSVGWSYSPSALRS